MESLTAAMMEILLHPAVLVGASVTSLLLLSGLAARVVELADGHRPSVVRRTTRLDPVTSDRDRDLTRS